MVRDISKIPVGDYKVVGEVTDELLIDIMEKEKILPVGWDELYVCRNKDNIDGSGLLRISNKVFVKVEVKEDEDKIVAYVRYNNEKVEVRVLNKKESERGKECRYKIGIYKRIIELCNMYLVDKLEYVFNMEIDEEKRSLIIEDGISDNKIVIEGCKSSHADNWKDAYTLITMAVSKKWKIEHVNRQEKIRFDGDKFFSYWQKWCDVGIKSIITDMIMLEKGKDEVKVYYKREKIIVWMFNSLSEYKEEIKLVRERFVKEYEEFYVGKFKISKDECLMLFKNIDVEDLGIKPKYKIGVFNIV